MLKLSYLMIFLFMVSQREIIVIISHTSYRAGGYYRPEVGAERAERVQKLSTIVLLSITKFFSACQTAV